jgi:hypothetical protein
VEVQTVAYCSAEIVVGASRIQSEVFQCCGFHGIQPVLLHTQLEDTWWIEVWTARGKFHRPLLSRAQSWKLLILKILNVVAIWRSSILLEEVYILKYGLNSWNNYVSHKV